MALPCNIPRQLAPTVGPSAATGVTFRSGPRTASGQRVASGLILTLGAFDCIMDNAACFADAPPPNGGSIVHFGDHRVYVAAVPCEYPSVVLPCSDALSIEHGASAAPRTYAEVCMTATTTDAPDARTAAARPTVRERGGPSAGPVIDSLEATIEGLLTPINAGSDPATAAAGLEAQRQRIVNDALEVANAQRRMLATMREYQSVYGFTPAGDRPSRLEEIRLRGGALGGRMEDDD